jgi:hypothetical protein
VHIRREVGEAIHVLPHPRVGRVEEPHTCPIALVLDRLQCRHQPRRRYHTTIRH